MSYLRIFQSAGDWCSTSFCITILLAITCVIVATPQRESKAQANLRVDVSTMVRGDDEWDWKQARTTVVGRDGRLAITTMSRTAKVGTHAYHDVYVSTSNDAGQTWQPPVAMPSLRRDTRPDGFDVVPGDLWPSWHPQTGTILITGKTFNFAQGAKEDYLRERVAYAVFDPSTRECGPLKFLELPGLDFSGSPILAANAGCNQPAVMENGDILLPIRYQREPSRRIYTSIVARCRFDGSKLEYIKHGSEHSIPTGRGLYEPSVFGLEGLWFLTLRADDNAYVAKSSNGVDFGDPQIWKFDDGHPLGSYNTQQHWGRVGGRLYLIYTRRGADNDHIMRHRAPLFIAQVDPHRLCVIRATEQVVVPEEDATLGNFGVCQRSRDELWVTVAEGRVSMGPRRGQPNRVFLVKITDVSQATLGSE